MSTIGERVKQRRKELKLSQDELAYKMGYLSRASISKIEKGGRKVPINKVDELAMHLQTTTAWLMGWESDTEKAIDETNPVTTKKMSIYGGGTMDIAVSMLDGIEADFCYVAKDDSMVNAKISKGDIVFIKRTSHLENGDIAFLSVNGETMFRRYYYDKPNHKLLLPAENSIYPPLVFINDELKNVSVVGKAVALYTVLK